MSLLAAQNYDPAVAVVKSTSALLAMTALDTTNLRAIFSVPLSGNVLVRLRGVLHGSTAMPMLLFGVLEGATVKARAIPSNVVGYSSTSTLMNAVEAVFAVTGLTPGAQLTWDAAYGVEVISSSNGIKYGGPDDAVGANAFGAFQFEVWEA